MSGLLAAIVALARAIPGLTKLAEALAAWWTEYEQKRNEAEAVKRRRAKLDAIDAALRVPSPPADGQLKPPDGKA